MNNPKQYTAIPESGLPQFRLLHDDERKALRKLRCSWGDKAQQAWFRQLVSARLAFIADLRTGSTSTPVRLTKRSDVIRSLKRRAKQVRDFAGKLEKPLPGLLLGDQPPVSELRLYADNLASRALSISQNPLAVSVMWSGGFPKKRKAKPESRLIEDLIQMVWENTGEPHFESLAVLLKRPCGNENVEDKVLAKRLRAQWDSRIKKLKRSPRGRLLLRRSIERRTSNPYSDLLTAI